VSEAPKFNSLPLISPISVTPQPSPLEVGVGTCSLPNGQIAVIMQFATPQGVQLFFISQEMARVIAGALQERAGSVLIVPAGTIPQR
jgi:hypothetical protein